MEGGKHRQSRQKPARHSDRMESDQQRQHTQQMQHLLRYVKRPSQPTVEGQQSRIPRQSHQNQRVVRGDFTLQDVVGPLDVERAVVGAMEDLDGGVPGQRQGQRAGDTPRHEDRLQAERTSAAAREFLAISSG